MAAITENALKGGGNGVRIYIHPFSMINYGLYYIKGLSDLFPNAEMIFDNKPFGYIINNREKYRKGIGVVLQTNYETIKIYIDTNDLNTVDFDFYNWSDVYAKINVSADDGHLKKLLPIGPSFGINYGSKLKLTYWGLCNFMRIRNNTEYRVSFREFIGNYIYPFIRRRSFETYNCDCDEDREYIFTLSTLWYDAKTDMTTNRFRGIFAKECKKQFPKFEGGFLYLNSPVVTAQFPEYTKYLKLYSDILVSHRMSMHEYLSKTRRSSFVFNTPSVCGCLGWKLGEYLAMGKAIISTPLGNIMPGEFTDGKHFIAVNDESEIASAITFLRNNPQKIDELKKNARTYFNEYLMPRKVIERIINKYISLKAI
ncbi:MAG: glycosyltransferase [Alistipes sp.]|nr:glycosyltransferase [Alistipes sp.]